MPTSSIRFLFFTSLVEVCLGSIRGQVVLLARACDSAGGNPVLKGTNQSIRIEFWADIGNNSNEA